MWLQNQSFYSLTYHVHIQGFIFDHFFYPYDKILKILGVMVNLIIEIRLDILCQGIGDLKSKPCIKAINVFS